MFHPFSFKYAVWIKRSCFFASVSANFQVHTWPLSARKNGGASEAGEDTCINETEDKQ